MQKYLPIVWSVLLLWVCSCDHEESRLQQVSTEKRITITDLEHEPAVKDLLSNCFIKKTPISRHFLSSQMMGLNVNIYNYILVCKYCIYLVAIKITALHSN